MEVDGALTSLELLYLFSMIDLYHDESKAR